MPKTSSLDLEQINQIDTTLTQLDVVDNPNVVVEEKKEKYTKTQKVLATIGITAVLYYILYKAGSLD